MKTILVHGAFVRGCNSSINNLEEYIDHCHIFCYGFVFVLTAPLLNGSKATKLASIIEDNDIVVAHSNGNIIADKAIRKSKAAGCRLVALSPALDSDYMFSSRWGKVDIFYNPGDKLSFMAHYIPKHPWGAMMATGILGRKLRLMPIERNHCIPKFMGTNTNYHHGIYLEEPSVRSFGPRLNRLLGSSSS